MEEALVIQLPAKIRQMLNRTPVVPASQAGIDNLPPNRLGSGEQAAIAYARAHGSRVAGLDDLQAHLLAEALGPTLAGTLGILLRAKKAGLISTVRPLLDAVMAHGFHVNPELYRDVLEMAGEAP